MSLWKLVLSAFAVMVLSTSVQAAMWTTIFFEDFNTAPSGWSYAGQQNGASQDLIRYNTTDNCVDAEWDQSNSYIGAGDPYTISPSRYSHSLGAPLTDSDTFKFGAKIRIGSVVNTSEFYQVANFGLYNLAEMGNDRTMSDNGSKNANIIKDGSDFVEFNYFINNNSMYGFYPMTQTTIGAHIEGLDGKYIVGNGMGPDSMWHDTDMGQNNWLPTDTDLYVEVVYYGNASDDTSRRGYSAIYTDQAHTQLLSVNGVGQYYWTMPVDSNDHFTLTDVGFWNYVGSNYGGANGGGFGSFDDFYVSKLVPEPASVLFCLGGWSALIMSRRRRIG